MTEQITFLAVYGLYDAALSMVKTNESKWLLEAKAKSSEEDWRRACKHYFETLQHSETIR